MNVKTLGSRIKRIPRIWQIIALVGIIIGGYFLFFNKPAKGETLVIHRADFLQQVSASGKVVAEQNLDLSFGDTGRVARVYVKAGDHVKTGQLLASQNTAELAAQLAQMQAGVNVQKAKLAQLLAGSTPEAIKTAEDAVDLASQNLSSEYTSALGDLTSAYTAMYNSLTIVTYLQNTYFYASDQQSLIVQDNKKIMSDALADAKKYIDIAKVSLSTSDIDSAIGHTSLALHATASSLDTIRTQCDQGAYYLRVSISDKSSLDTQKSTMNTSGTTISGAKSAISSAKISLSQAQDQLASAKAPARPSDIAVYQAQIKEAQASEQNVIAQINKKRIYSPIIGIVASVPAKAGNVFSANEIAVSVISAGSFQIESYIPEVNISFIQPGQDAEVTLDAYGSTVFEAKVISVDPAETIKDGVSNYKVVLEFVEKSDEVVKSGMTGNVMIITEKKSNVIAVPQGIVTENNGHLFVTVKQGDSTSAREVSTGSLASNGTIEITSGLQEGDVVVVTNGK